MNEFPDSPGVEFIGGDQFGAVVAASPLRLARKFNRATNKLAYGKRKHYVEAEWIRDRFGRWMKYIGIPKEDLWKKNEKTGVEEPNFSYGTLLKSPFLGDAVLPGESRNSPYFARIASNKLDDGKYLLEIADNVEKLGRVDPPDKSTWDAIGSVLPVEVPDGSTFIKRQVGTGGTFVLATKGRAQLSRAERERRAGLRQDRARIGLPTDENVLVPDDVNAEEVAGFVPDVESGINRFADPAATVDTDGPLALGDLALRRELSERAFSDEVFQEWLDTVEDLSGRKWEPGDEGAAASMYEDYIADEVAASVADGLRGRGVEPADATKDDVDAVLSKYIDDMLPGLNDAFDVFDDTDETATVPRDVLDAVDIPEDEEDIPEDEEDIPEDEEDISEDEEDIPKSWPRVPPPYKSKRKPQRWVISPVTGKPKLVGDWFPKPDMEKYQVVKRAALEREQQEFELLDTAGAAGAREALRGVEFSLMDGLRDVNDPDDLELLWNVLDDVGALDAARDPSNDLPLVRSLLEEALNDAMSDDGRAALNAALEALPDTADLDAVDIPGGAAGAPLTRLTDVLRILDVGRNLYLPEDAVGDRQLFDRLLDEVALVDLSKPDEMQSELERLLTDALDLVETEDGRSYLNDALQSARYGAESFYSDAELEELDLEDLARLQRENDQFMLSVYERQRLEAALAGEVRELDAELDEIWRRDMDGIAAAQRALRDWDVSLQADGYNSSPEAMIAESVVAALDGIPSDLPLPLVRKFIFNEAVEAIRNTARADDAGTISGEQRDVAFAVLGDVLQILDPAEWSRMIGDTQEGGGPGLPSPRGDLDSVDVPDGGDVVEVPEVVDDPVRSSLVDWLAESGASSETLRRVATARNEDQVVDAVMVDEGLPGDLFDDGRGDEAVERQRLTVPEGGWDEEDVPVPWMDDQSLREMGTALAVSIGERRAALRRMRDGFTKVADEVEGYVDGELVEDEYGNPRFNYSLLRGATGKNWGYAIASGLFHDFGVAFGAYDRLLGLLGGLTLYAADPEKYAELEAEAGPGNNVVRTLDAYLRDVDTDFLIGALSDRLKEVEGEVMQNLEALPRIFSDETMSRIPLDGLGADDGQRILDGIDNFNADLTSLRRDPNMLDRLNRLAGIDPADSDADQRLLGLADEVFKDQMLAAVNRQAGEPLTRDEEERQRDEVEAGWDELFAAIAARAGVSPEDMRRALGVDGVSLAELRAEAADDVLDAMDIPQVGKNPPGGRPAGRAAARPKSREGVVRELAKRGLFEGLADIGRQAPAEVALFEEAVANARQKWIDSIGSLGLDDQYKEIRQLLPDPKGMVSVKDSDSNGALVSYPFKGTTINFLHETNKKLGVPNVEILNRVFGPGGDKAPLAYKRQAATMLIQLAKLLSHDILNFRDNDNAIRNARVGVAASQALLDRINVFLEAQLKAEKASGVGNIFQPRMEGPTGKGGSPDNWAVVKAREPIIEAMRKVMLTTENPIGPDPYDPSKSKPFLYGVEPRHATDYTRQLKLLGRLRASMEPGSRRRQLLVQRFQSDASLMADFKTLEQDLVELIEQIQRNGTTNTPSQDVLARRILSRLAYLAGTKGNEQMLPEFTEGHRALAEMAHDMYMVYQRAHGRRSDTDRSWDLLTAEQLEAAASVVSLYAGKGSKSAKDMNNAMMALRDAAKLKRDAPDMVGLRYAALNRARWLLASNHLEETIPVMNLLGVPIFKNYLRPSENRVRELADVNLGPARGTPRGGRDWTDRNLNEIRKVMAELRAESVDDEGRERDDAAARLRLKTANLLETALKAYQRGDYGAFEAFLEMGLSRLTQVGKGRAAATLHDIRDVQWGISPQSFVNAAYDLRNEFEERTGIEFPKGTNLRTTERDELDESERLFNNVMALIHDALDKRTPGSVMQRVKLASALWGLNQVDGAVLQQKNAERAAAAGGKQGKPLYPTEAQLQRLRNELLVWDPNADVRQPVQVDAVDVGPSVVYGVSDQRVADAVRAGRLVANTSNGMMSRAELAMELGVPQSELDDVVRRLVGAGLLDAVDMSGFNGFALGDAASVADDVFAGGRRKLWDAELVDAVLRLFPTAGRGLSASGAGSMVLTDPRVVVVDGVFGSVSAEFGLLGSGGVPDPRVSARWDPSEGGWVLAVAALGGFRVFGDMPGADGLVKRRYGSLPELIGDLQVLASLNRVPFPADRLAVA